MNIDAFCCMRRGFQLSLLNKQDSSLIAAIEQRGAKKERALLLLHGFGSTPAVFRLLLPSLSRCYDALFCPVLIGHAESIDSFAKAKASDWLLQVEQSYESLVSQFEQVEVLGLSLGGLLACHLSTRFSLAHLYLLAPALDLPLAPHYSVQLAKTLHWLGFRAMRARAGNLYSSEHCEIAYRQLPLTSVIQMLTLVQQFQFTPPSCPTDLFLGCYDKIISSQRVAERFADKMNINTHWLSNSAHVLPLDGDIDHIIACIKQNRGPT